MQAGWLRRCPPLPSGPGGILTYELGMILIVA